MAQTSNLVPPEKAYPQLKATMKLLSSLQLEIWRCRLRKVDLQPYSPRILHRLPICKFSACIWFQHDFMFRSFHYMLECCWQFGGLSFCLSSLVCKCVVTFVSSNWKMQHSIQSSIRVYVCFLFCLLRLSFPTCLIYIFHPWSFYTQRRDLFGNFVQQTIVQNFGNFLNKQVEYGNDRKFMVNLAHSLGFHPYFLRDSSVLILYFTKEIARTEASAWGAPAELRRNCASRAGWGWSSSACCYSQLSPNERWSCDWYSRS